MGSTFGVLNIARQGILANQTALQVVSNNISNASTEGYSRQTVNLEAVQTGGVRVQSIQRMTNQLLASQVRQSNSRVAASGTLALNLQQVEYAMGESEDTGLSSAIDKFYAALEDLSLNPGGSTEREAVRSGSEQMCDDFSSVASQLTQLRQQLDEQIVAQANQVNSLCDQLADYNSQLLKTAGNSDSTATNNLLDQRDSILNQLSSIVPIRVVEGETNQVTVFGGNSVLVEGSNSYNLEAVADPANGNYHKVVIKDISGNDYDITSKIESGSLGALISVRDGEAKESLDSVEQLAAEMIRDLNVQHRAGSGLDGVTGRDLFQGLEVTANAVWANTGGAGVTSAAITDDTALTFDDYEIRFTAGNTFDIVDTTTGSTLSTGNAYTSGAAINFGGMRVTLSNSASGGPAAGDVFDVNSYSGTAERMALSNAVAADTNAIAAGQTSAAGDNTNVLALSKLRDSPTMGNPPTQTYEDYFNKARLSVATAVSSAQYAEASDTAIQEQAQSLADSVSGVSLDDEAISLIQYQRAFQACSRIVNVLDEMMQSLVNMF